MSRKLLNFICIPITETTATRAFQALRQAMAHARWIELRLDFLRSTREMNRLLHLLSAHTFRHHHLIFTLRRRTAGGQFRGSLNFQLRCLNQAAQLGHWIDVELETVETRGSAILKELRTSGSKTIVSYHDFETTPADLARIVRRLKRAGPDLLKISVRCRSVGDAARLLELQKTLSKKHWPSVVLGMDSPGIMTRILGPSRGAAFTFASLARGKESAPGQLTVAELHKLYRMDHINSKTRMYGLLGHPVGHSLSPVLYNAAFARLKMNAIYLPFHAPDLGDFTDWTKKLGVQGFSVTLPHKSGVRRFLSKENPTARQVGAVNTLRLRSGKWEGFNTDVAGIARPLKTRGISLRGKNVLLLGAGGAAQAAAAFLAEEKAKVFFCNRTPESARRLARRFRFQVLMPDELGLRHFALILNATSIGMWPNSQATPLDLSKVKADIVFDMVYTPAETQLLKNARRHKLQTISGMEMFVAQAEEQFKILTGRTLPRSVIQQILKTTRS